LGKFKKPRGKPLEKNQKPPKSTEKLISKSPNLLSAEN
jgi:hypothetical protein